ncbi:hypothetical protein MY10362_006138 [Beauveria mimosiformis]
MIATSIAPLTAAAIIIFATVDSPPDASSLEAPEMLFDSCGSTRDVIVGGTPPFPVVLDMAVLINVVLLDESVVPVVLCIVVEDGVDSVVEDVLCQLIEDVLCCLVEVVLVVVVEAVLSVVVEAVFSVVVEAVVGTEVVW